MTNQPEALRLADALEADRWRISAVTAQHSADLLRAQHAEIELLRAENTMIVLENERLMRQIYDSAIRARGEKP